MDRNIKSVGEYFITAGVPYGRCPLDWLAKYYRDYSGKMVTLDGGLMDYLLNKSSVDIIEVTEHDGFEQRFKLIWNATEKYPETFIEIGSYGRNGVDIETNENGKEEFVIDEFNRRNWFIILELKADDILVGKPYAYNVTRDKQLLHLTMEEPENYAENVLLYREEEFEK